jgi:hypothetical protein
MSPLLALLLGCSSPKTPTKVDEGAVGAPPGDSGAYEDWSHLVVDDPHAPQLSPEEVAAQIESVFSLGFPRPQDIVVNFFALMTAADEDCPGESAFSDGFQNLEGCTTDDGHFFQGAAGLLLEDERDVASDGTWTGTFRLMSQPADYAIYRPDGTSMQGAGVFMLVMGDTEEGLFFQSSLSGYFSDEKSPTWLGRGFSGFLEVRGELGAALTRYAVDGYVEVDGVAIELESVLIDIEDGLTQPVSGTVSLRQSDATWYRLELVPDGSGCGALSWENVEQSGALCVDLSELEAIAPKLMVY